MILETLAVGPFESNSYIVGCEKTKKGMIVDAGADAGRILKTAQKLGLSVNTLVLTHTHIDHIAAAKQIIDAIGAKLAVHEAEDRGKVSQTMSWMLGSFVGGGFDKFPPVDILLKEGDTLEVGELRFKVLHTPGHTPGGISLYGEDVVFTGDTLFQFGIGRTDFPGSSYEDMMSAISGKLMTLPDETKVYPGHGPASTIGVERKWNPFLTGQA